MKYSLYQWYIYTMSIPNNDCYIKLLFHIFCWNVEVNEQQDLNGSKDFIEKELKSHFHFLFLLQLDD